MRKRHAFQPSVFDHLEDRLVLSQLPMTATTPPNVNTSYQPQIFNYQQAASAINQTFNTFRTNFDAEMNAYLNPVEGEPSVTLPDLQSYASLLMQQLGQQLQTPLINITGSSSGFAPFLSSELSSQFGGDLSSTLNSIPGNSGTGGTTSPLFSTIANDAINGIQLAANNMLSAYAWGTAAGQNTYGSTTPPPSINYSNLASEVNQAINSFRTQYSAEQSNFTSGSAASPVSLSQLQGFNTQNLNSLSQQLQTMLSPIAGASTGLTPFLTSELSSAYGGDLLSTLNSIPGNTGTNGTPDSLYGLATGSALNTMQLAANDMMSVYDYGMNQGENYAQLFSTGGNGNVINANNISNALNPTNLALMQNDAQQIEGAYQTFANTYANAISSTLQLNPTMGFAGSVNLSGNQTAFNSQVQQGLTSLSTSLGNVLSSANGASTSLIPELQNELSGTNGLQGSLANLSLPTDLNGTSNTTFVNNATQLINQSYNGAVSALNLYGLNNNFNFSPYSTAGSFLGGPYGSDFSNYPTLAGNGVTMPSTTTTGTTTTGTTNTGTTNTGTTITT